MESHYILPRFFLRTPSSEVTAQNLTKLWHVFAGELDLKMDVKNLRVSPLKSGKLLTRFRRCSRNDGNWSENGSQTQTSLISRCHHGNVTANVTCIMGEQHSLLTQRCLVSSLSLIHI